MIKFVIDEDMPRSTAKALRSKGIDALDIRDHGLRGKGDDEVFSFAQKEGERAGSPLHEIHHENHQE